MPNLEAITHHKAKLIPLWDRFPGASVAKNSPAMQKDTEEAGLVPVVGKIPEEVMTKPPVEFFIENPGWDRGAWRLQL